MLRPVHPLRHALKHFNSVCSNIQLRGVHASVVVLARRNRRGSPTSKQATLIQGSEKADGEDFSRWFNETQKHYPSKVWLQDEKLPNSMELADEEDDEEDEGEESDEETEKFLDEAEDLFRLNPSDFRKRMNSFDQRHAHEDYHDGDNDDNEIDRVTERIPKKKLLKMMKELNSNSERTETNTERMPTASLKKKNSAPLEKKAKLPKAERVTYRQESVGIAVLEFVQNLLVGYADLAGADIVPSFVEANVSPDLRRIVLFWEPVRLNSGDQKIGKKKVDAVKNRLQRQERWVRRNVTQHLNLKYSPVVQFKQQKEAKNEEAQTLFENEMKWLDRV